MSRQVSRSRPWRAPRFGLAVLCLAACAGPPPSPAVLQVEALLRRGDLQAAEQQVGDGLRRHPDDPALTRLGITVRVARGDRGGAVRTYRAWVSRRGADAEMLRHLALEVLRFGLKDRDPELRIAAIHAARQTDAAPLEDDVAQRLSDPDEVVRTWAAVALSSTPAGADVLEAQLRSSSPAARAVAVSNLARLASKAALPTLRSFVDDRAPEVRAALARGLAQIREADALALLSRLGRDPDPAVRTDAVASLGRLGLKQGIAPVRSALADPYLGVRLAAVVALADLDAESAAAPLRALAEGPDLLTALRAGVRLARLGEAQPALNAVAKGLVDRRWPVRAAACNAASGLTREAVALELVARALRDSEPRVRLAAAAALLARGPSESGLRATRGLHALACSAPGAPDEELCFLAAELLARAGDAAGPRTLERLVRTGRAAGVRLSALRAASSREGPAAELALAALADPATSVAVAAAILLYGRRR